MKLKIAAIGLVVLTITTCSVPAGAKLIEEPNGAYQNKTGVSSVFNVQPQKSILSDHYLKNQALVNNGLKVKSVVKKLKSTVGKTWYVFSGSTPSGWDCSGLTMWFYGQLGVPLEHRASKQQVAGKATNNPKPGDLVIFKYKGYKTAYHVGVYIGDGLMIHAPRKGEVTRVESVTQFGGKYSKISYRSLIQVI
jgi:cell wall-associated NlpC family hydrolase